MHENAGTFITCYFLSGARAVNHGEQGVESTEFEVGTLMQDFPQDLQTRTHQEMRIERELFYDDIKHVEASAYDHSTDLQISAINIYGRPNVTAHIINHVCTYAHQTELSVCFGQIIDDMIAQIVLIWS